MLTIEYEEIKLKAKKSGKCVCGKRRVKQKTFTEYMSPYHSVVRRYVMKGKNPDEHIDEIRKEIYGRLEKQAEEWKKEPVTCKEPSYWSWTKEQRDEYEKTGKVEIELTCGHKIIKSKNK